MSCWYTGSELEKHSVVGSSLTILPGVKIGIFSVIRADSLVRKSVESGFIFAGNPCVKIKDRDTETLIELERKLLSTIGKFK